MRAVHEVREQKSPVALRGRPSAGLFCSWVLSRESAALARVGSIAASEEWACRVFCSRAVRRACAIQGWAKEGRAKLAERHDRNQRSPGGLTSFLPPSVSARTSFALRPRRVRALLGEALESSAFSSAPLATPQGHMLSPDAPPAPTSGTGGQYSGGMMMRGETEELRAVISVIRCVSSLAHARGVGVDEGG